MNIRAGFLITILSVPVQADFYVCEAEKHVFISLNSYGVDRAIAQDYSRTYIVTGQHIKSADGSDLFPDGCKAGEFDDELNCKKSDGNHLETFWMNRFGGFTYTSNFRISSQASDMHSIIMGQCKKITE